jgi:hypothetical protein
MINIEKILQKEPTLTPLGIEGPGTFTCDNPDFDDDYIRQINTCINWLKGKKLKKTLNKNISSYGIKHILERELDTYVSNGCFIAAVIHLGIPYYRIPESPNIFIPIASREFYKNIKAPF